MKKFLLLIMMAVLLVGCNTQTTEPAAPTETGEATQTTEPAENPNINNEKPFVATYQTDFISIAPLGDVGAASKQVLRNMHEGLYKYDNKGNLTPGVAEIIEVSTVDGYVMMHIRLKEGLTFHDGSPLTTEDVEYSYFRLAGLNPEIPAEEITGAGYWPNLLNGDESKGFKKGKIERADELNMTVYFDDNYGVLTTMHTVADGLLVPSGYPESSQKTHPIGIGPYKFVSYTEGDRIVFTRFDEYYGDKPEIKNVEFVKYADESTLPLAFEAGEIDMMDLTNENYDVYASRGLYVDKGLSNDIRVLNLNMREGRLFADKNLRIAMQYAIDKNKLNTALSGGRGTILYTHFTPFLEKYYNANVESVYSYDLEKAKEFLALAGKPDGFQLVIKTVAENTMEQDMVALMIEDLAKVGIIATNDPIPWNTYYEEVYRGREYDAAILNVVGYPDPSRVLGRYLSSASGNVPGLASEEYDRLLGEAQGTADQEGLAIEDYKKMQMILTEEAVGVFTIDPGVSTVLSEAYTDYVHYPFAFDSIAEIKYK